MNFKPLLLASLLVTVAFAPACVVQSSSNPPPKELPKPSTDFPTNKIYPSTSAQDDGTNLTVYAALLASGKFLTLGATDRLVAKVGTGPEIVLQSQGQTYDPHYFATVASTKDELDVVVTLDRAGTADDHSVTLHLPAGFDLDGALPSEVKQGIAFDVAVLPAPVKDESVWWAIAEGDCVQSNATSIASITAQGKLHFQFDATTIKKDATSCTATVKVQHVEVGTVDPAFEKPFPTDTMGVRERRFKATLSR